MGTPYITHVRHAGTGRFYENIIEVRIEEEANGTDRTDTSTPLQESVSVARLIEQLKRGARVFTKGDPPIAVEVFAAYGREFIRSANGATSHNDLLALPTF